MTTTTVLLKQEHIVGFCVSGHAGYAEHGRDIVCAAVSVLITTCANALESVVHIEPTVTQDEQSAVINIRLPKKLCAQKMHDAQIVLQTILQGFDDIAMQYPTFFQLIDGRKTSC